MPPTPNRPSALATVTLPPVVLALLATTYWSLWAYPGLRGPIVVADILLVLAGVLAWLAAGRRLGAGRAAQGGGWHAAAQHGPQLGAGR